MIVSSLDGWREYLSVVYQIGFINEVRFLLIGGEEQDRRDKVGFVKGSLENFLEEAKSAKIINRYKVEVIDLVDIDTELDPGLLERVGNHDDEVYVPIFYQVSDDVNFPLDPLNGIGPVVFSMTKAKYDELSSLDKIKTLVPVGDVSREGDYDCFFLD